MNILFYLEPHPIRSPRQFLWIAVELMRMLLAHRNQDTNVRLDVDMKIFVSRTIAREIRKKFEDGNIDSILIEPTREEAKRIKTFDKPWNEQQIETWTELLTGQGEISAFYSSVIERLVSDNQPDVIVTWGTNGALRSLSMRSEIPVIHMEQGCTRTPFFESIYLDPTGLNGSSYSHRFDLSHYVPDYPLGELQAMIGLGQEAPSAIGRSNEKPLPRNSLPNNSARKTVLIPLQLRDDVNIILHSPYQSMLDFAKQKVPRLIDAGYECLVKPHPGAASRSINKKDHQLTKQFVTRLPHTHWLNNFDSHQMKALYRSVDSVVVINSSVGFEALLMGATVIPCGASPYKIGDALPDLDDLLNDRIAKDKASLAAEKVANAMTFRYLHLREEVFQFSSFVTKIGETLQLKRKLDACKGSIDPSGLALTITPGNLKEHVSRLQRDAERRPMTIPKRFKDWTDSARGILTKKRVR
jgi:capsule polysaccharide export protein KpsC/LpsZ